MWQLQGRARWTVIATTVSALTLAACGGSDDGDAAADPGGNGPDGEATGSISLVVARYTEGTEGYWDDLIERFEEEHEGATVDLRVIDWGDLRTQVNTMVQTRQLPDLLNINFFADYAEADLLYRADELLSAEQLDDFLPNFAENAQYDGEQYAFPFVATVNAMYYNTDIFEEAGVSEPPETWDDFLQIAETIRDLPGDYVPYAMAMGAEGGHLEFGVWSRANGGGWKDGDAWAIDSDRNIEAMEFMRSMDEDGLTQSNPGQTNRADGTWPLFAQGQAGMVFASLGTQAFLEPLRETGVNYASTTHPVNGEGEPLTLGVQDYLMAFKQPGNQELLSAFLGFFYEPDNYVAYLETEGLLPTTASASEVMRADPDVGEYIDPIPQARFDPTAEPVWGELRGALGEELGTGLSPDADVPSLLGRLQELAEAGA